MKKYVYMELQTTIIEYIRQMIYEIENVMVMNNNYRLLVKLEKLEKN